MGEYPVSHDGRELVQVVDDAACAAMLGNVQREAQDPNFAGLCLDYEHFRHDPEKESRAAGWVMNIEQRRDGIYAAPRWSTSGKAAVEGGDYRFISPEFDPRSLQPLGGNRYRVTRLVGFGLTNNPNMRGMAALTNRATLADEPVNCAGAETAHAGLVTTLARSLRAADKSLPLALSYARAGLALDARANAAGALVISNRARELRGADKRLSLSASYRLAQAKAI